MRLRSQRQSEQLLAEYSNNPVSSDKQLKNKPDKNKSGAQSEVSERDQHSGVSNSEREEFPWIETQERREGKTVRGSATGPDLNKTNEYITGLFYLHPNGFTS